VTWRVLTGEVDAAATEVAFGYWLAGLIDGEGCFRIHKQKAGDYYAPSFSLKLRDDDTDLIKYIVERTGFGHVARDTSPNGNSRPCVIWRVDSRVATEKLAAFLERYPLRSRKARDWVVWQEAVRVRREMKRGNRWDGPRDWTPLIELKAELEQAREYVPPEGGDA
jgi:hypothetical protein